MTATPKFYNGDNDDIASMDDEKIYGKCIFSYNTGCAIAEGRLTDYKLLSIYADSKSISQDIKKNKLISYKNKFTDKEANYVGTALVLLKKIHYGTINHLITYHNTIDRANKFSELLSDINELLDYDDIYINYMTGSDSMGKRRKIINEFVGSEKSIL
jgi:predicted helicase